MELSVCIPDVINMTLMKFYSELLAEVQNRKDDMPKFLKETSTTSSS
jgi:hypothetical protein